MTVKLTRGGFALVIAAVLIGIAGVSYAAIPGSNGVISACKDPKGSLRVIDAEAGQACSGNQQPLSWNQQGPQGPPGPTGPAGPPGESSIRDYEWLFANSPLDSTSPKAHIVSCPYPKRAVGGGGLAVGLGGVAVPGVAVFASYPAANGGPSNAWEVRAQETVPTDTGWRIHAHVVCANVS